MSKFLLLFLMLFLSLPVSATTICYDGKGMAADSQITAGGTKLFKAHKLRAINGTVVGCAGDCTIIKDFITWFKDQSKPKPTLGDDFQALVVSPGGVCMIYFSDLTSLIVSAPMAIGSGKEAALGAMYAGADAKKAVEYAAQIDLYTGGAVQYMEPKPEI